MPYTKKQVGYFHANKGKKGITPSMVREADASVKGGNYLPAKRTKMPKQDRRGR